MMDAVMYDSFARQQVVPSLCVYIGRYRGARQQVCTFLFYEESEKVVLHIEPKQRSATPSDLVDRLAHSRGATLFRWSPIAGGRLTPEKIDIRWVSRAWAPSNWLPTVLMAPINFREPADKIHFGIFLNARILMFSEPSDWGTIGDLIDGGARRPMIH